MNNAARYVIAFACKLLSGGVRPLSANACILSFGKPCFAFSFPFFRCSYFNEIFNRPFRSPNSPPALRAIVFRYASWARFNDSAAYGATFFF